MQACGLVLASQQPIVKSETELFAYNQCHKVNVVMSHNWSVSPGHEGTMSIACSLLASSGSLCSVPEMSYSSLLADWHSFIYLVGAQVLQSRDVCNRKNS